MRGLPALLALLLPCSAALAAAPAGRLGVFALRLAPGVTTALPTGKFLPTFSDAIRDDLQQADVGQVVALPWPEALPAEGRPTFETFVGVGREAGCRGVLILTLAGLEFTERSANLPLAGRVTTRTAKLRLSGGLIDVATATAVANLDLAASREGGGDRGSEPRQAMSAGVGQPAFDRSAMGAAVAQLRPELAKEVAAGLPRLQPTEAASPEPRAGAPAGVSFELAAWPFAMAPGFGQRGTVAVVNRGAQPRRFVIQPVSQPTGVIVAALGQGSPAEPCDLGPGQWKYVRVIFNAPQPTAEREVVLGLFTAATGQAVATTGEPTDRTVVRLAFHSPTPTAEFQIVSQDPATLVYTCRVLNPTDQPISGLRLTPDPNDGRVDLSPSFGSNAIHGSIVPAQGSLTFKVIPHLRPGERSLDVTLRGYLGLEETRSWPLHFEVPEGRQWYLGTGHTTQYTSNSFESCVNQGDVLLDWGSVNGEMMFKCGTDRDLPDDDTPFNFREWEHAWLSYTWDTFLDLLGIDTPPYVPSSTGADVRGATIRPKVAARLAGLDRDATEHPMASDAKDWLGLVWYAPMAHDRSGVLFASIAHQARAKRIGYLQLSDPSHDARWPYLRARHETSQAYVVWEDAAPGQRSDVAFRASGRAMDRWRDTVLLTDHGQGVDDPVVHVDGATRVAVAWSDRRSGTPRVYLRLSDDDGRTFRPELAPAPVDAESQLWPQFVYTPTGLQLIWSAVRGTEQRIMTCAADATGRPIAEPTCLSRPGVACGEPQLAVRPDGTLYAAWRVGDGAESEIEFATAAGPAGPWSPARALTQDTFYSEYPLVGVTGERVWVTWHGDAGGLADLKYYTESHDGGATWSSPWALASLENVTSQAWLEVSFQMQWPRGSYAPFTTVVQVNDQEVGRLVNVVPDGTYLFELPPSLVPSLASRRPQADIRLVSKDCSGAHYLLATNTRLLVRRRFSQVPVVAASQAEADELAARVGADLNHNRPDLVLCANDVQELPAMLPKGAKVDLPLRVHNLGEAPATGVRVVAYGADPRDPLSGGQAPRLGEAQVGTLALGQSKAIRLTVTGQAAQTPRLFVAVTGQEPDEYPDDNLWIEHFVVGEEQALPPLVGTDVPHVLYAPALLPVVQLPNVPALQTLLAQPDLASLLGHADWPLPPTPSLESYLQQALSALHLPNLPGPNVPNVPRPPGVPQLP